MRVSFAPYLAAACAATLFGASVVATRSIAHQVPPVVLAWLRYLPGAIALSFAARARPSWKDALGFLVLGGLFFAAFPVTFQLALRHTSAMRGSLVLALIPILTALLSRWHLKEPLGERKVAGLVAAFSGVVLLFVDAGLLTAKGDFLRGDALMLVPAFCASVYVVFGQPLLKRFGGIGTTGLSMLGGVVLLLPLVAPHAAFAQELSAKAWATVAFLALPGGAIGFALWIWANSKLPPGRVGIFLNLNPIAASVLGALLLREPISPVPAVALALVVVGIMLVTWQPAKR